MEIVAKKTIGFSLNEQETSQLKNHLGNIGINYSDLTAKETILALAQKATEASNALIVDNESVNKVLIDELREENQSLINLNQELTEKHQELTENNSELTENNLELKSGNLELLEANNILENREPVTKEIKTPTALNPFQFIITLNHFQLRLAAKVANDHSVESLYNKQAQKNRIAFVRIEGEPKERIGQLLKNLFMGLQYNYHKGSGYLPESVLSTDDIRKAAKYHEENQE